jgi:hypothetical protein
MSYSRRPPVCLLGGRFAGRTLWDRKNAGGTIFHIVNNSDQNAL